MTTTHGKNGKVKIGANAVAEITKWTLNESVPTADSTAMGDSWQTHEIGIPSWSGSLEGHYDPGDTNGQVALGAGDSVTLKFYHDGDASGKAYRTGTATVTGRVINSDMGDTNKISFEFTGNGALSDATES